jgi:hypothetical protein
MDSDGYNLPRQAGSYGVKEKLKFIIQYLITPILPLVVI